jgi:hypothetical protein
VESAGAFLARVDPHEHVAGVARTKSSDRQRGSHSIISWQYLRPFCSCRFEITGLDVSQAMLNMAKAHHPRSKFILADICEWEPEEQYDLIVAWG